MRAGRPGPGPARPEGDRAAGRRAAQPRAVAGGETWPVKGRIVGIIAGQDSNLKTLKSVRQAVLDANIIPLVIAPAGGVLGKGANKVTVQRTFAAARSVEFDALLLAGVPGAGADAFGARDAKAGNGTADAAPPTARPAHARRGLPARQANRQLDGGQQVLSAAGIPAQAPGVLAGEDATQVLTATVGLLGQHRVWDRFPVPAQA